MPVETRLLFTPLDDESWFQEPERLLGENYWSWLEPDPVSRLGEGIDRNELHPLLRKGKPRLDIEYEALMLFGEGKGIISRASGDGVDTICWREVAADGGGGIVVNKSCETVYLRGDGRFQEQFGLEFTDELEWPEMLSLVQYRHLGEIIAWTLVETACPKASAEESP